MTDRQCHSTLQACRIIHLKLKHSAQGTEILVCFSPQANH